MARRRKAQQAFLPPLRRRRTNPRPPASGVASHQHIHQPDLVGNRILEPSKETAMELLDRYLQAVRKYLPFRRQDDIIAELRANMESQLLDKEAELGRPLTIGEQEDLLRKMGHP